MEAPQINLHRVNWQRIFLIGIIIFLLCLNYVQCENQNIATATIEAQNSEISTYKLKNGQLVTSQKVATLTEKELKELRKTTKELKHVPETWTFKTKTILKLAFLLTSSEKARQLKQEVFNYDKELYSELSHTTTLKSKRKEEFCFENIRLNFPQVKIEELI